MSYSREQLQKIYLSLPSKLREAIFDVKTADKIYEISQKYKLSSAKIPLLASEVGMVLLAVLHIQNFINSLKKKLKIDEITARDISQEIAQTIFSPVKEELKRAYEEKPEILPEVPSPEIKEKPEPSAEEAEEIIPEKPPIPKTPPKKYEIAQIPEEEIEEVESKEKPPQKEIPEKREAPKPQKYQLRTMKKDIERLKGEISEPEPRLEGNVVDLKNT